MAKRSRKVQCRSIAAPGAYRPVGKARPSLIPSQKLDLFFDHLRDRDNLARFRELMGGGGV